MLNVRFWPEADSGANGCYRPEAVIQCSAIVSGEGEKQLNLLKMILCRFAVLMSVLWISGCSIAEEQAEYVSIPLKDASKYSLRASVAGVPFNVPVSLSYRGYSKEFHGWPHLRKAYLDDSGTRLPFDYINIEALYPDMTPIDENNFKEFEVLGHGKRVAITLTYFRPWDYYFKHTLPLEKKLPESPDMPGMHHYFTRGYADYYLSHNYSTPDLTRVRCHRQSHWKHPSPGCVVETSYRPDSGLMATIGTNGAIYRLEYRFAASYLPHWREMDAKIKAMFDQFIRGAVKTRQ